VRYLHPSLLDHGDPRPARRGPQVTIPSDYFSNAPKLGPQTFRFFPHKRLQRSREPVIYRHRE
jgi:hypothetical protein